MTVARVMSGMTGRGSQRRRRVLRVDNVKRRAGAYCGASSGATRLHVCDSGNDAYFWVQLNRFYHDELPKLRPHLTT